MTIPDSDKDILVKLDRREARKKIIPGIVALAWACAAGVLTYNVMKWGFGWIAPAPLYGALVAFLGVVIWLLLKVYEDR
jgi:hypothetical protein